MNKDAFTEPRNGGNEPRRFFQTASLLPSWEYPEGEVLTFCVACLPAGVMRPATGHTSHPEYRRLALCTECIAHYDSGAIE
jgi:hypothetical protein